MLFQQLPSEYQHELTVGFAPSSLALLEADKLLECYQDVIEAMVEEGAIDRKTGKSKLKDFKKVVRKLDK